MKTLKIGFIGAGNMATAIIRGMIGKGGYQPESIFAYDLNPLQLEKIGELGVQAMASAVEIVKQCDVVFLAVKPQNYEEVLTGIRQAVAPEKIFVTIAAGISTEYIMNTLGIPCPVVRAMPNTPLLLGKGATALCKASNVTDQVFHMVLDIFAASGDVAVLTEDKMNTVIAVNGSSPAYIYLFAKAIVDWAAAQNIENKTALELICKTLEGSAEMLRSSGNTPDELIKMVSSPGGTTLKAMEALKKHGFYEGLWDAMDQCTKRAEELGR